VIGSPHYFQSALYCTIARKQRQICFIAAWDADTGQWSLISQ